jgi:hypothetical protein
VRILQAFLMGGGVPNPGLGNAPEAVENRVNTILGLFAALAVAGCVAGVLWCATSMALCYRRGDIGDQFMRLGMVGGGCVLIGGASSFVAFII